MASRNLLAITLVLLGLFPLEAQFSVSKVLFKSCKTLGNAFTQCTFEVGLLQIRDKLCYTIVNGLLGKSVNLKLLAWSTLLVDDSILSREVKKYIVRELVVKGLRSNSHLVFFF